MRWIFWAGFVVHVRVAPVLGIRLSQLRRSHQQPDLRCDASWPRFGGGPLQHTSTNPSRRDGAMDDIREFSEIDEGQQQLFVDPDLKFAFCPIEKDACSYFDETLSRMLTRNTSYVVPLKTSGNFDQMYSVGTISQNRFGIDGIKKVFADPEATRAVFVRDPLQRFLSAYLNKCVRPAPSIERKGEVLDFFQNCPMYKPGLVFKDAVEWALKQPDMLDVNPHWRLQAHHCQLSKYIDAYNVIGVLSPSLSSDVKCLFERAGLAGYNHEFHVDDDGQGKRKDNLRSATEGGNTDEEFLKAFFSSGCRAAAHPAHGARLLYFPFRHQSIVAGARDWRVLRDRPTNG